MIQDLKADSARWEQERRSTSRSAGGAAGGDKLLSKVNGVFVPGSNSPAAPSSRDPPKYHTSETHHNRQYYGPTSATDAAHGAYGDAMAIDSYPNAPANPPRQYPGTGNAGYYGVNSNNPGDAQPYGSQAPYNPRSRATKATVRAVSHGPSCCPG